MGTSGLLDLENAVSADVLIDGLEEDNPFQLAWRSKWPCLLPGRQLGPTSEYWQVPMEVPPRPGRQDTRSLGIDIQPLMQLHAGNRDVLGERFRWTYKLFYFEMLAREEILVPDFWVATRDCPVDARRYYSRVEKTRREGRDLSSLTRQWKSFVEDAIVEEDPPENWLDLVVLDREVAGTPGLFVQETIYLRRMPAYISVSAGDVRDFMRRDILTLFAPPPRDASELMDRWKQVAERLGRPIRYPSQEAVKLDERDAAIVALVMRGLTPPEIAQRLLDESLHPVRERDKDSSYDEDDALRNATRTVYRIIDELKEQRRITEEQVNRRPRGRPPKED